MNASPTFGQIVRERRLARGLTQAELARRVHCATVTIRKIEYDSLRPSVQVARRLAISLHVDESEQTAFVRLARSDLPETPLPTPAPMPDEIGQKDLSGRSVLGYELGERIGAGGFGVVYRAVQRSVDREVAVKIILPQYANQPPFIRRFESEAQTVAQLEHPHIVPLYDYWREPDAAYLIMRFLRGGSLETRLRQGPISLQDAQKYLYQVCQGLHLAHRHGLVHRDIKPANVLLDEDRNAYLSDFGIAKYLDVRMHGNKKDAGALTGSPAYAAPEELWSEPVTPETDIYSLGILLYEMLAGEKPFPGPTPALYVRQHLLEPLPSITAKNASLPPVVDTILLKATAKDARDRYPDVPAFLGALQSVWAPVNGLAVDEPRALGERIPLGMDQPVSFRDMAQILSNLMERPVKVETMPGWLRKLLMRTIGLFNSEMREMIPSMGYVSSGQFIADTTQQRQIFGDVPDTEASFARWVKANGLNNDSLTLSATAARTQ